MSSRFYNILLTVLVVVLVVLLVWSLNTESGEPVVSERRTTDTLVVTKIDTLRIKDTELRVLRVVDTTYIEYRDSIYVPVPISEYHFSEKDVFDFSVSGYDVTFLGAEVYPKTIYTTVTNETVRDVTKYRSSLFVFGGFSRICGAFSPKIGLALSLKGKWLISADLGLFDKRAMGSLSIGYNILQK